MHKLTLIILLVWCSSAGAWQPSQPVTIIVANPVGGSTDSIARITGEALQLRTNIRFIIVNRPGAQGVIGSRVAMNAPADGYTLLLTSTTFLFAHLMRQPNADYDPVQGLTHVGLIATVPTKLYARSGIQGDLAQVLDQLRNGNHSLAVTFAGAEFAAHMMSQSLGRKLNIIRYNNTTTSYVDLMGGHIDFLLDTGASAMIVDAVRTQRVRLLATLDRGNKDSLERLLPGVINVGWFGLSLPAGAPATVVNFYQQHLNAVLGDSDVRNRLQSLNIDVSTRTSPTHFVNTIENDRRRFYHIADSIRPQG